MTFIAIDTSTKVCSAALLQDGAVLQSFICYDTHNHAALLPQYVESLLNHTKQHSVSIDAVVLCDGPGSYTGLRISTALAKGLCYGLNIPLIAVSTLTLLAIELSQLYEGRLKADDVICPMIDARRMEVYCALYQADTKQISPTEARIVDKDSFSEVLKKQRVFFFGDGAGKCKETIKSENAVFVDDVPPNTIFLYDLAEQKYREKQFEDIAYFEPNYLKEYQAKVSKNKVIG